jgi:hypothetical protein
MNALDRVLNPLSEDHRRVFDAFVSIDKQIRDARAKLQEELEPMETERDRLLNLLRSNIVPEDRIFPGDRRAIVMQQETVDGSHRYQLCIRRPHQTQPFNMDFVRSTMRDYIRTRSQGQMPDQDIDRQVQEIMDYLTVRRVRVVKAPVVACAVTKTGGKKRRRNDEQEHEQDAHV